MNRYQELKRLKHLQSEADAIRHKLGIHAVGAILYKSLLYALEDEIVLVEADGFGGAATCIVEGNYPVDYVTKFEKCFASEEKAFQLAEDLVEQTVSADMA